MSPWPETANTRQGRQLAPNSGAKDPRSPSAEHLLRGGRAGNLVFGAARICGAHVHRCVCTQASHRRWPHKGVNSTVGLHGHHPDGSDTLTLKDTGPRKHMMVAGTPGQAVDPTKLRALFPLSLAVWTHAKFGNTSHWRVSLLHLSGKTEGKTMPQINWVSCIASLHLYLHDSYGPFHSKEERKSFRACRGSLRVRLDGQSCP